jgi:hypothetical protein
VADAIRLMAERLALELSVDIQPRLPLGDD